MYLEQSELLLKGFLIEKEKEKKKELPLSFIKKKNQIKEDPSVIGIRKPFLLR